MSHPVFFQIIIYDCERGTNKRTLNSKKYGVDLIHFTQHKNNVVHASTKENDIIRYLNVEGNKYISYFRFVVVRVAGHSRKKSSKIAQGGALT
jgi:hypothetical protein